MKASAPLPALWLVIVATAFAAPPQDLEMARLMNREGKTAAAIDSARKAAEVDPADVAAARMLQDLLLREGREDEAAAVAGDDTPPLLRRLLEARSLPAKEAEAALKTLAGQPGARSEIVEMLREGYRYGLVTMCIGGGMGAAGVLENLNL